MSNVDGVICINHKADCIAHLSLICCKEFVVCSKFGNFSCLGTNLNALVLTVVEYKLHYTAHIEECGVVPTVCLTGLLGFNTTDDVIVSRIFNCKTS